MAIANGIICPYDKLAAKAVYMSDDRMLIKNLKELGLLQEMPVTIHYANWFGHLPGRVVEGFIEPFFMSRQNPHNICKCLVVMVFSEFINGVEQIAVHQDDVLYLWYDTEYHNIETWVPGEAPLFTGKIFVNDRRVSQAV